MLERRPHHEPVLHFNVVHYFVGGIAVGAVSTIDSGTDLLDQSRGPEVESWRSGQVEAVEVHDLVPRRHEVPHELLPGVVRTINLS